MWLLRSHRSRKSGSPSPSEKPWIAAFAAMTNHCCFVLPESPPLIYCLGRNPMLRCLEVQQFALVEQLRVEFDEGLNLLTGETGSGNPFWWTLSAFCWERKLMPR